MATLFYLGRLMDALGTGTETLAIPPGVNDTAALRTWLDAERQLGGILTEPTVRLAINDVIVSEPCAISDTDEIAFLPPVGGG
ncbi:MoaD/ThiS family protein [Hyphomonas johnsonii]|uniref:Putative molybdopterin converting factor subunit 1 n=1 Tax=Hyphomonas johnsonii MHS-2 TaxID=1280950 RepID=A0A059FRX5_9PROT|nr:MoaD/ThiS family protein [Hyphomonas johnsonii]KCZ93367.1 putative molybdopterin converting factor subunit 1 [Hyphomonas johnsonii MHS-2]